jgi:hypothetical protein
VDEQHWVRNCTRTELKISIIRAEREGVLTFVLFELVKVGGFDAAEILSEPVDLASNGSPEYLVKHGIGHVVVGATFLVLGDSKCVL